MELDPAAAALVNWQAARSEQIRVELQLEHVRRLGPPARLAELLVLLDKVEIRAALLLAHAIRVKLACDEGWLDTDPLTSTRMGLEDDLRER
jgi:hypothetical protein